MDKANVNVGVYAGILCREDGKLLLRRRLEEDSIIQGKSFKGNWELPGGGVEETKEKTIPYSYAVLSLVREVMEEVGILVSPDAMPLFYPVMFKTPDGKYDLAMVTVMIIDREPNREDIVYVSPEELNALARDFVPADKKRGIDGRGIVSGYGKRMHCMCLAALSHSPNSDYSVAASLALLEIKASWDNVVR